MSRREKWIWMPHAGHLCVGQQCRFRLNTWVGRHIVSTVGEYRPDPKREYETVGSDRLFETMVFKAMKSDQRCCPYTALDWGELDFQGYNDAGEAYEGHIKMCRKWAAK